MIATTIIAEIRRAEASRARITRCPPMPAFGVMSWDGSYMKTVAGGKVPVTTLEVPGRMDREYL